MTSKQNVERWPWSCPSTKVTWQARPGSWAGLPGPPSETDAFISAQRGACFWNRSPRVALKPFLSLCPPQRASESGAGYLPAVVVHAAARSPSVCASRGSRVGPSILLKSSLTLSGVWGVPEYLALWVGVLLTCS